MQSQPCTAVAQIRLSGHEAPSTKLLHLVLAKFRLHLSWQTCSRMAHEGLSPGPLSITNQVLRASRPILSCVVLRPAPSFQPLLKMCFPESLPQATSSAPGLARPYSHDFQQLHMDSPNFTNIQTSSKGEKYPQTPLRVSKNPQSPYIQYERYCLKKPKSNFKKNVFQLQIRIVNKKFYLYNARIILKHIVNILAEFPENHELHSCHSLIQYLVSISHVPGDALGNGTQW